MHTTLLKMACNEKVIMCVFKPLQVFNRLVIINSQLNNTIFNTCAMCDLTISIQQDVEVASRFGPFFSFLDLQLHPFITKCYISWTAEKT